LPPQSCMIDELKMGEKFRETEHNYRII